MTSQEITMHAERALQDAETHDDRRSILRAIHEMRLEALDMSDWPTYIDLDRWHGGASAMLISTCWLVDPGVSQ